MQFTPFLKYLYWGLGCASLILVVLLRQLPDDRFHVYFLDIGQGDSILIKTPQNHQILIDGGPENTVVEELSEVIPYFDKSIDLMVLTHPHEDHLAGLVEVLERYEVENVLFTGVQYKSGTYFEFLKRIEGLNIFFAEAGTDFQFGNVLLDVIYPFESVALENFENVNNSSVAIRVVFGEIVILLTGDLEVEAEEVLIESGVDLEAYLFKAGHHGSRTSSTWELLKKVQPAVVVIQSGEGNSYDHPHPETLRNFARIGVEKVFRNDLEGRVEFVF